MHSRVCCGLHLEIHIYLWRYTHTIPHKIHSLTYIHSPNSTFTSSTWMIVIIKRTENKQQKKFFWCKSGWIYTKHTYPSSKRTNKFVCCDFRNILHNPYIENIIYTLPFCNNLPLVTNFKNSCTHTLSNEYFTKVLFCLKIFIPNAFWRKTWFKHYEYHSASENGSLWPFMSKLHKASWLGNETWETNTCFFFPITGVMVKGT